MNNRKFLYDTSLLRGIRKKKEEEGRDRYLDEYLLSVLMIQSPVQNFIIIIVVGLEFCIYKS